jgi:acetyl esterase/lipase
MKDRILRWTGAGVLAAGLSTSMALGAGVASAAPDAGGDRGSAKTTQSSDDKGGATADKASESSPASSSSSSSSPKTNDPESHSTTDPESESDTVADRPRANNRHAAETHQKPSRIDRVPASLTRDVDDASAKSLQSAVEESGDPAIQAKTNKSVVQKTVAVQKERTRSEATLDTAVSAVSAMVSTILNPLATNNTTPEIPAAQPQMWTLAAASRREFETAFESPALVEKKAPVENSLTYTPKPALQDQITLLFQDGMKAFSAVTGINLTSVIGNFLASKNPPFFLTFGLNARQTTFTTDSGAEWEAWEISPSEPTDKTVIAFHGGGWIYQPNLLNWVDYTRIPRETGATVVVPLYPLATTEAGKATTVIPDAADVVSQIITANGDPDNVSIFADSAGSSIAMSTVRELILADKPVPSHMVLLSLVADSSLQNPDIREVDDPLFDVDNAAAVWKSHYYDGIEQTDPLVSPLFWDNETLAKLPPTTIYVGEREILYPDTLLLHHRAVEAGAPLRVVVGTGLPHDWPASGLPVFTQAVAVHDDILRQLGLADDTAKGQAPQLLSAATGARPSLINVVGSFFFNAFRSLEQALAGQPQVPPGSTVRVQRSTLNIDCGPGYPVDADWYFPDTSATGEPATRLIYFQHGFPGSGAEYDYTAAELAERNQAIVVAPTISSNLFDCYGCQLGGDPMHAAIGRLFLGDRDDLLASAKEAGFDGDSLPERFVIAGHSGGGQLAGGAAGYFEEFAPADEDHNLVGVLLLDTSPVGGAIERGVGKIPDDIPVYTIAAAPSFLNSQGGVEGVLEKLRPDTFVGVELVNGTHGDAFQSHNPLVQIGGWIVGMGIPRPANIAAVQQLATGWIDDWYDGTAGGDYGDLGSTIEIPDTDGAQAYVLPAPPRRWSIVDLVVDLGFQSLLFTQAFATCAEDPSAGTVTSCTAT